MVEFIVLIAPHNIFELVVKSVLKVLISELIFSRSETNPSICPSFNNSELILIIPFVWYNDVMIYVSFNWEFTNTHISVDKFFGTMLSTDMSFADNTPIVALTAVISVDEISPVELIFVLIKIFYFGFIILYFSFGK